MKKNIVSFCLCVFCFIASFSYGDIIPKNSHWCAVCVTVSNPDDFDNIVFIAQMRLGDERGRNIIQPGKCLIRGYKLNQLAVYWAKKDYVEKEGFDNLEIENNDENIHQIIRNIPESSGYVSNKNSLSGMEVFYKIVPDKTGFHLYKYKTISKFNNGSSNKIQLFEPSCDITEKQ